MLFASILAVLTINGAQERHPEPASPPAGTAVIVREADTMRRQSPPPHNGVGESTAYRISDGVPNRNMEFRKRILHQGASIGLHVIAHDEVYYVLSGEGDMNVDGVLTRLKAGDAAYLYDGENVGIQQVGDEDLALIIAYPLARRVQ